MAINILKNQSLSQLSAWDEYVPIFVGIDSSLGTTIGRYIVNGKNVYFWAVWEFTAGTTSPSVKPTLSLPVPALNSYGANVSVLLNNAGVSIYVGVANQISKTEIIIGSLGTSAPSNGILNGISGSSPFSWNAGDQIILSGAYEAE